MHLNEHDPEYGAFMLNLDDFESRQQRKVGRKLSRLRTDAVRFFAKLKLQAQAKSHHWDDRDIRWELNAVADKMTPRVRRRQYFELPHGNHLTRLVDQFVAMLRKPSGAQAQPDDYEQSEEYDALYRVTLEKLKHPMKRDEFYLLVGAFVHALSDHGITKARSRDILTGLLYDAAEAAEMEKLEATAPEPEHTI